MGLQVCSNCENMLIPQVPLSFFLATHHVQHLIPSFWEAFMGRITTTNMEFLWHLSLIIIHNLLPHHVAVSSKIIMLNICSRAFLILRKKLKEILHPKNLLHRFFFFWPYYWFKNLILRLVKDEITLKSVTAFSNMWSQHDTQVFETHHLVIEEPLTCRDEAWSLREEECHCPKVMGVANNVMQDIHVAWAEHTNKQVFIQSTVYLEGQQA